MQSRRHLDVSIILCTLLLKIVGLWLTQDSVEERRRKAMIAFTLFSTIFATFVEGRDLYFTWLHKGDVLYVFTNILTVVMALIKIYIILMHKVEFLDLIAYMQDKFWNVDHDTNEEAILENCRRTCIFFISGVSLIGVCVMFSYVSSPFTAHSSGNESERLLIFNMWTDLPLSTTPYYEMTYVLQVVTLCQIGVCYFCFDTIFCIMTIHVSGNFNILRYRFSKLCDVHFQITEKGAQSILENHVRATYAKLKIYVRQHQALIYFCEKLEDVYTMIILGQVLMSSLLICLFGYQMLLAHAPPERRSMFFFLISGSMALLFMFTYGCNSVMDGSADVAMGAYSTLWMIMPMNKLGRMLRKDLIMVIVRSRKMCCLTANGFFPVSLKTYTSILSTAVSYFTLLRNHAEQSTIT
ncbi:odorant receptor 4-like [Xylocopa sonorina]|uniref:odorant receptor 4-like n=1 Tax=Xylocopa sonorina TaxID=1818115 RepID=UPI00403AEC64